MLIINKPIVSNSQPSLLTLTWPMAKLYTFLGPSIFSRENKPFKRLYFRVPGRLSENWPGFNGNVTGGFWFTAVGRWHPWVAWRNWHHHLSGCPLRQTGIFDHKSWSFSFFFCSKFPGWEKNRWGFLQLSSFDIDFGWFFLKLMFFCSNFICFIGAFCRSWICFLPL